MNKPLFVISCPIDTYSGYGSRSRDLVKAIIEIDKYDVKILPQRWGSTPFRYTEDHKEEWGFLSNHLLPNNQLTQQPEIWMQITIPSEFQRIGKYNIGVTAGIESTICNPKWIEGLNRMDINWVSSNHSKKVFENSKFNIQGGGLLQNEKPIEVVMEGANLNVFKHIPNKDVSFDLSTVEESFCYLFIGHWMQGHFGHDRKNVSLLVKSFLETFKNKDKKPALILKTTGVGSSIMDREEMLSRIDSIRKTVKGDLPNIYLLHGELTEDQLNQVYNHPKVKAMVSLTKGEGFGRPLLEFTLSKKPVIATNFSGHLDFLRPQYTSLIGGHLENIHESAVNEWLIKESQWFAADTAQVGQVFTDMFKNYSKYQEKGKKQENYSRVNFSYEKMKNLIEEILNRTLPEFPKQVQIQLPSLNLPKLQKITT
jgi:glycosyltransferase involved in cell wall biosynthesis